MNGCEDYDIDSAWNDYCEDGNIYTDQTADIDTADLNNIPKVTDIYISTKTKIAYLTSIIDLYTVFWNIKVNPYHLPKEGVVKKQMKFCFADEIDVNNMTEKILNEQNVDQHIISRIVNPDGRIKFRDIRKISIGLSQKDILCYRSKKKGAFYNCFVLILRIIVNDEYKEIHVKVFNTGKLEIPGIRDDSTLIQTLDLLIDIIKSSSNNKTIGYDLSKSETVLINSNFNCGFYINRDKLFNILKYKYKIDCIFDPCQYPGIQCKIIHKDDVEYKLSFMIFRTGSILIVGKCTETALISVYNYIKTILKSEYKEIMINNDKQIVKPVEKKLKKRIIYVS